MSKTKVILLILLLALVANLTYVMYGSRERRKFKQNGVIVLAKIIEQQTINDQPMLICQYHFKGSEYHIKYPQQRMHEPGDSLVFLYIIPENPNEWMQMDKYVVPSCLTLKDVPAEGWREPPLRACY